MSHATGLATGPGAEGAGKLDEAERTLRHVEKHDEKRRLRARYYEARIAMKRQQYDAARKQLAELSNHDDKTPGYAELADRIAFHHAAALQKLEQFEEAAKHFERFLNRHKQSDLRQQAHYQRAFSLHRTEAYERSIDALQPLKDIDDRSLWQAASELRAENHFLLGQYDKADGVYARLIEQTDDNDRQWVYRFHRGQAAFFQDDMKTAVERLKPVAALKQLDERQELHRAAFLLGDAQLQRGDNDAAAQALQRYLELTDGPRPEARLKLGLAQLRRGDEEQARRAFA